MDRDTQGKQVKPYAKKHMSVQHQLNNIDCGVFAYVVGDSDSEKDKGLFVPPEVCENGKSAKDGNVIYVVQIE